MSCFQSAFLTYDFYMKTKTWYELLLQYLHHRPKSNYYIITKAFDVRKCEAREQH